MHGEILKLTHYVHCSLNDTPLMMES